jgi:hypothetical protein
MCGPRCLGRYSESLQVVRPGDRIPGGAARFSAPVQTRCGAHPVSYTMGTRSFPGVKRPGRDIYHSPPSSTEGEGRAELYICSHSGPSWPLLGWTWPLHFFDVILEGSFRPKLCYGRVLPLHFSSLITNYLFLFQCCVVWFEGSVVK